MKDWDYFEILEKMPETDAEKAAQKYSIYLTGENHTTPVEIAVGFDAGSNKNIPKVTYANTSAKDVIINTNGGELIVDATNDTVFHYGVATKITVKAVADKSFHEFGKADIVNFAKGRFVAEAGADVSFVNITATNADDIKGIEINNQAAVVGVTVDSAMKAKIEKIVSGTNVYTEQPADDKVAYCVNTDGVTFFTTLQDAFKNGGKIVLLKDVKEDLTVDASKVVVLNLNGKILTNKTKVHTIIINSGASLTVDGEGTVDNISHAKAAIYNNGGTVILNGGKYTRSFENGISKENSGGNSYYTINNYKGKMTINENVTVTQNGHFSSLIINAGTEEAEMTINGGLFIGGVNTVKNDEKGTMTINNGTFKNVTQFAVLNWATAVINNGYFESTGDTLVNAKWSDNPSLTINGGTFICGSEGYVIGEFVHSGEILSFGTIVNNTGSALRVADKFEWNSNNTLVTKG